MRTVRHALQAIAAAAFLPLALPGTVLADPPPGKQAQQHGREQAREARKQQREWEKDEREWARDERKAQREWTKDQREADKAWRKAERQWAKDQRKAWRERQKALREARRLEARSGWYDGDRWHRYEREYRYRGDDWVALRRHPAPLDWAPPPGAEVRAYAPGMRLPASWYGETYVITHDPYGLPPPPPRHRWVQVDDDAVLVALATGVVADFVYDLFD